MQYIVNIAFISIFNMVWKSNATRRTRKKFEISIFLLVTGYNIFLVLFHLLSVLDFQNASLEINVIVISHAIIICFLVYLFPVFYNYYSFTDYPYKKVVLKHRNKRRKFMSRQFKYRRK